MYDYSLAAAAQAIYDALDEDGPHDNSHEMICLLCSAELATAYHAPNCPWLKFPSIIEVLRLKKLTPGQQALNRGGESEASERS